MDLNAEIERLIAKAEAERDRLDAQIKALRVALGMPSQAAPSDRGIVDVGATISDHVGTPVGGSWRGKRNATRNAIVMIMADGRSRKVGEIARKLGKSSNATSAAVRALRDSGVLVENGKQGYYKIAPNIGGAQIPESAVSKAAEPVVSKADGTQEEALTGLLGQQSGEADIVGVAGSPGPT